MFFLAIIYTHTEFSYKLKQSETHYWRRLFVEEARINQLRYLSYLKSLLYSNCSFHSPPPS